MTALLSLTGVLLLVSGGFKLWSAARGKIGVPLLALVESAAGVLIPILALVSPISADGGFRLVLGSLALMLVSSVAQAVRVRARSLELQESEGGRLVAYVKYLSAHDGESE